MATCATGQQPYLVQGNTYFGMGPTPQTACGDFASRAAMGGTTATVRWTGSICTANNTAQPTTKVCDAAAAEPQTPASAPPLCPSSAPCSLTVELPGAVDFDGLGITSQQMGYVWAWGVAAVLGLWVLGYIISCGIGAVRKA